MDDKDVPDDSNWCLEAENIINDINKHVDHIKLSTVLTSSNRQIYFNIKTKELTPYCVELSTFGFRIVGYRFDSCDIDTDQWFETPYSLLNMISPLYNESFGNCLMEKLNQLRDGVTDV